MKLILQGKSGCNFEIINKNFDFFLKKKSKNIESNSRLIKQANKQIEFYKKDIYPFIKTPEITLVYDGNLNELSFIEMKYIFGQNIISFLEVSDISTINMFIENLLSYIDNGLKNIKIGNL